MAIGCFLLWRLSLKWIFARVFPRALITSYQSTDGSCQTKASSASSWASIEPSLTRSNPCMGRRVLTSEMVLTKIRLQNKIGGIDTHPTCYRLPDLSESSNIATRERRVKRSCSSATSRHARWHTSNCTTSWTTYARTLDSDLSSVHSPRSQAAHQGFRKSQIWTNTWSHATPLFSDRHDILH